MPVYLYTYNINISYPTIQTIISATFMCDFRKFVLGAMVKQYWYSVH